MDRIENGKYGFHSSSIKNTQIFSDTLRHMRGKHLKHIFTCLYCNKRNNVCQSDTHKYVSCKKWYTCYKYVV